MAKLRVKVKIKDILKEKKKTKYWFVKNMEQGYQSVSNLMNNESTAIKFDTLEKVCQILECEPSDVILIVKK